MGSSRQPEPRADLAQACRSGWTALGQLLVRLWNKRQWIRHGFYSRLDSRRTNESAGPVTCNHVVAIVVSVSTPDK
jgi:hypothetical protein